MKSSNQLLVTAFGLVFLGTSVGAQAISSYGFSDGYNDGDLVLAFFSAADTSGSPGGTNSEGDVLFDLGPISTFTGLAENAYSVGGFNGNSASGQSPYGFGSAELIANLTVPSTSTYWTIMGSNTTTNQLWLTGQTAQKSLLNQASIASEINNIGNTGSAAPNADGSAYDPGQTTENYLVPYSGHWNGTTVDAMNTVSSTENTLGLYSLIQGGSSTYLGVFTLAYQDGTYWLYFGFGAGAPPTSMPEPSTWAVAAGTMALGAAMFRRLRYRLV